MGKVFLVWLEEDLLNSSWLQSRLLNDNNFIIKRQYRRSTKKIEVVVGDDVGDASWWRCDVCDVCSHHSVCMTEIIYVGTWLTPCIANTSQELRLVMPCHQLLSVANVLNNWPSLASLPHRIPLSHPPRQMTWSNNDLSMKVYFSKVLLISSECHLCFSPKAKL